MQINLKSGVSNRLQVLDDQIHVEFNPRHAAAFGAMFKDLVMMLQDDDDKQKVSTFVRDIVSDNTLWDNTRKWTGVVDCIL